MGKKNTESARKPLSTPIQGATGKRYTRAVDRRRAPFWAPNKGEHPTTIEGTIQSLGIMPKRGRYPAQACAIVQDFNGETWNIPVNASLMGQLGEGDPSDGTWTWKCRLGQGIIITFLGMLELDETKNPMKEFEVGLED